MRRIISAIFVLLSQGTKPTIKSFLFAHCPIKSSLIIKATIIYVYSVLTFLIL